MSYYGHASAAEPPTPSFRGSSSSGGGGTTTNIDAAKIFVGGLSWQTNEETIRYHFEQYGEVASVEVMRDRNTGDPRGFAFVVFKSDETVDLILKNKPHEINHKVVDVKRAQARGIAPPSIHGAEVSAVCVMNNVWYCIIFTRKDEVFYSPIMSHNSLHDIFVGGRQTCIPCQGRRRRRWWWWWWTKP